ncbi:GNAT family N-acetyltransferase [Candidatus Woesearchaeota archaeon]|nr:GNAT family N-acetyltransferase [Candidatus Woesearchaeota archaeon]
MNSLNIRSFEERDFDALMRIYEREFQLIDGLELGSRVADFHQTAAANNTLVALLDEQVVGGATYFTLTEESLAREYVETVLHWARRKRDYYGKLRRFYKKRQEKYGGTFRLEFFHHELTNQRREVSPKDVYLRDLFVSADYARRGIGSALAREQLRRSREGGATAIYVTVVESSHSLHIFKRMDFLPLLHVGPAYSILTSLLMLQYREWIIH